MGLISGFFFRGDRVTLSFTSRDEFDARVTAAMTEFGFQPVTSSDELLTFRPSMRAGLGVGRISIIPGEGTAPGLRAPGLRQ